MFPILRELQASNPDGVTGEVLAINQVVRSSAEIEADTPPHAIVFLKVGEQTYVDVVDTERNFLKGDTATVEWRTSPEGDAMPLLK